MIEKIKKIKKCRLQPHVLRTYDIMYNLYKVSNHTDYKYYYNEELIAKTMYGTGIILVSENMFIGYNKDELDDIYNIIKKVLKIDDDIKIIRQISL